MSPNESPSMPASGMSAEVAWRCKSCDAASIAHCAHPEHCGETLREDFRLALNEFLDDFARDPGISWDEAIDVFEAKIAEMRAELRRNA